MRSKYYLTSHGVQVSQDNDAIFCSVWVAFLIYFNFRDSHGRKGILDAGTKDLILVFSNIFPRLCGFVKTEVFFEI